MANAGLSFSGLVFLTIRSLIQDYSDGIFGKSVGVQIKSICEKLPVSVDFTIFITDLPCIPFFGLTLTGFISKAAAPGTRNNSSCITFR